MFMISAFLLDCEKRPVSTYPAENTNLMTYTHKEFMYVTSTNLLKYHYATGLPLYAVSVCTIPARMRG
tara:strand:- start:8 stop:211 length:204 start_codon:yes stop_codon:yes gene_type:complete